MIYPRKEFANRALAVLALKKTELLEELEALMEDDTAGDPMSTLKWSRKSTYAISKRLRARNIFIPHCAVE